MIYFIDQQDQLYELEKRLSELEQSGGLLAVDTEFLREKTFRAKLCLIQLGLGDDQYCIDVLSMLDLSVLARVFENPKITKLFHAARQDIEVLWQTLGVIPKPIFDTQMAAAFCGSDLQIGHTALIMNLFGVELSKSQARTDWTKRPLTPEQLEYAAEDVTYLVKLYESLIQKLEDAGKTDWFLNETESLYQLEKYDLDPSLAYLRLSGGGLKIQQQYALKALAGWRETYALKRDIPRSWVLKDDRMYDLAINLPTSADEILSMKVFGKKSAQRLAPRAAKILAELEVGSEPIWTRTEPLDKQDKYICSQMMQYLSKVAKEIGVAQGLIGTRKDIEKLYRKRQSNKLLSGWRYSVIGQALLDLIRDVELRLAADVA